MRVNLRLGDLSLVAIRQTVVSMKREQLVWRYLTLPSVDSAVAKRASTSRLRAAQCHSFAGIPPFGRNGHSHVQQQKQLSSSLY